MIASGKRVNEYEYEYYSIEFISIRIFAIRIAIYFSSLISLYEKPLLQELNRVPGSAHNQIKLRVILLDNITLIIGNIHYFWKKKIMISEIFYLPHFKNTYITSKLYDC